MDANTINLLLSLLIFLSIATVAVPFWCAVYLKKKFTARIESLERTIRADIPPPALPPAETPQPQTAPTRVQPQVDSGNSALLEELSRLRAQLTDGVQSILQAQTDTKEVFVQSFVGEFAQLNEKLNLLTGADDPLSPSPLTNWSFFAYREAYEKWKQELSSQVARSSDDRRTHPTTYRIVDAAGEIQLGAELIKIAGESGALHWIASDGPHVAILITQALTIHATLGVYLPIVIAVMHFIEVRHVLHQEKALKALNCDTAYLRQIHEDAEKATLRQRWQWARSLIVAPNVATARMQLRLICSPIVANCPHCCGRWQLMQYLENEAASR